MENQFIYMSHRNHAEYVKAILIFPIPPGRFNMEYFSTPGKLAGFKSTLTGPMSSDFHRF